MRLNYAALVGTGGKRDEEERELCVLETPMEWLIAALCQFDCNSLRSIEGKRMRSENKTRSGGILRRKREVIRCLGIIVRNNFSLSSNCEIIVGRSGGGVLRGVNVCARLRVCTRQ